MEQLDELIARGKGASVSIRRHEADWLCECHVVCEYACENNRSWCCGRRDRLGEANARYCCSGVVESVTCFFYEGVQHGVRYRIGYALAASVGIVDPLVAGRVTQVWLFDLVRKHFLAEFVGPDPLSVLDYLRVRLASVVQESVLDRLPRLKQVSILNYTCIVCGISKDI